jgi:hypothetical protein
MGSSASAAGNQPLDANVSKIASVAADPVFPAFHNEGRCMAKGYTR